MATGKPRFYWDAVPLIAWIKDEKRADPAEMDGLEEVVELAEKGKAVIMISVLWRAEFWAADLTAGQKKKLREIFDYRLIEELGIDSRVMDLAGEIRAYHKKGTGPAQLKNIRTPDAIHLASAINYEADEFHTFDGKKGAGKSHGGLLSLDGNVAGRVLRICAPQAQQLRLKYSYGDDEAAEPPPESLGT